MKEKIYKTIIIAMVALVSFMAVYSINTRRANEQLMNMKSQLEQEIIKCDRNVACLTQNYIYSNRGKADSIGALSDINGQKVDRSSVASYADSTIMVCRISEQHCSACTGYAVRLAKETGCPNVIYIANTTQKRSLANLANSFEISDSLIFGYEDHLSDADYLMFPYLLFCKGNQIKAIYIPFEANDGPDLEMLKTMIKKLNKNDL